MAYVDETVMKIYNNYDVVQEYSKSMTFRGDEETCVNNNRSYSSREQLNDDAVMNTARR